MDEGPRCTEQVFARQRAGLQCAQVIYEVTKDLIHELLWQMFPSGTGESLGDTIDPALRTARHDLHPQAGGEHYGGMC